MRSKVARRESRVESQRSWLKRGVAGARRSTLVSRLQSGFTLIECLVYCVVLLLVLGLVFATFYRVIENNRDLRRNAGDIVRALQAGEQWREDIRRASGPLQVTGAAPGQELAIPQTNGVVKYTFREGSVWRQAGPCAVEALPAVASSTMQQDARQFVTAWRWEVQLKGRHHVARVTPLFTFEAVEKEAKR